mmetsp:Transcript_49175/g.54975  ORF Transcript_49175/g.54975 Transcript_49175/m.54975 type:complete len:239 (-) Transcript_49175:289-1005(-)
MPGGGRLIKFDVTTGQSFATQLNDTIVGGFSMAMNTKEGYLLVTIAEGKPDDPHPPIFTGYVSVFAPVDDITQPDVNTSSTNAGFGPTCWIVYSAKNNGCTYAASTFAGSAITAFRSEGSTLDLLAPNPAAVLPAPVDLYLSPEEDFLYAISTGYTVDTLGLLPPMVNGINLTALVDAAGVTTQEQQPAIYTYQINPQTLWIDTSGDAHDRRITHRGQKYQWYFWSGGYLTEIQNASK